MKIDTTIYLKKIHRTVISDNAESLGISKNKFISVILRFMLDSRHHHLVKAFSRIKYQKREKKAKGKRFHVVFAADLYEKNLDMRKIYKMSVSHIIVYALERHLDEIINMMICNKNKKDMNNYQRNFVRNYIFKVKLVDCIPCLVFFWDIPEENTLTTIENL